ncbi:MAG: carboxymuconolactone decarboxylase family protein [Actinomycetota bacterium]|nr:carboxymuconolactone decarboxylase family protein [Actinomycetota bacterium]
MRLAQVPRELVDDPGLEAVLERAARLSTPKPAWYLTLAHNPEMAKAYAAYWDATHRGGRVEHTTKELMRIAISQLLGCTFCADQLSVVALEQGLDEGEAKACALPDFSPSDPRVRAAVRYARALVLERDPTSFDDVYAELHTVFDDAEIVELGCFAAIAIGGVFLSRSLQIDL